MANIVHRTNVKQVITAHNISNLRKTRWQKRATVQLNLIVPSKATA